MKIRILQICAVDFTVKNFLVPLIKFLQQEGFDVVTICSSGVFVDELRQEGLKIHTIPISRSMNLFSHIKSIYLLWKFLRKEKFDIIHVHTPIAALIGRIAGALAGVPIRIYTAHGFYFHDDMPPFKKKIFIYLEKFGHLFGHFIFTQSEEDRQTAIKEKICKSNEILTIGNGIDMERFNPSRITQEAKTKLRQELNLSESDKVVSIIGRIVKEKGYMEFFGAAKKIISTKPEVKFLVIGDALKSEHDVSKQEIFDFIHMLGIKDSIRFVGMRSDIPELLSITDIYTLPSYREGMPRSIIEAMAMGKPVVATNIRGCREEVINGETGYIIPPRQVEPLANTILDLLNNPVKAATFGEKGRERVLLLYDEKIVLNKQLKIINEMIKLKI